MRKSHKAKDSGALPGTPLRFTKASVMASGHLPAAIKTTRRKNRRAKAEINAKMQSRPRAALPITTKFTSPPRGTLRQRLAIIKGRIAHKVRAALGRFMGR